MIYLDYQATTPLAAEARAAMLPLLGDDFGNPHSAHRPGRVAAAAVEIARERVVAALGPDHAGRGRLVFTSGATEAVNWALRGGVRAAGGGRRAIVAPASEHACVLDTVAALAREGYEARIVPVGADGLVDLAAAARAIDGDTALVAAMLVNNEIGVIQPVAALAALARAAGAAMVCDAVQGFGRVPIPAGCDMIALSAHKIFGPKGIGALWLRDGIDLPPLLHGGGQQYGLRSGTLAPALCAGFGVAAQLLDQRREADAAAVEQLWALALAALGDGWTVNGSRDARYRGNLNVRRDGLDVGRLMAEVRDVAFSAGSACASGSGRPSHVLRAIGLAPAQARSSLRFGFGRYTGADQLVAALATIAAAAAGQEDMA